MTESTAQRSLRGWSIVGVASIAMLAPFIGKAFYIDDPLYIWAAKHIASDPLDFYGFDLNWYGCPQSMSKTMLNPPLTSYYLAVVGSLFGWSEIALHAGMLLLHVLTALGIYRLASQLTENPLIATFASILTPVFYVSSTQVMCDVLMLGFWVWSISFWIDGVREECWGRLLAGALLAGLCGLAKYFGAAVVPLLLLYSVLARPKQWIAYGLLALAIIVLVGYELNYRRMYGLSPMEESGRYSEWMWQDRHIEILPNLLTVLSFLGGCVASPGILALAYRPLRGVFWLAIVGSSAFLAVSLLDKAYNLELGVADNLARDTALQMAICIASGLFVLTLAGRQLYERRSPEAVLLAAFVFGTVVFSGYVNWIVNGRSLLPITVAGGILIGREIERWRAAGLTQTWRWSTGLAVSAALALLVTIADYMQARAEKANAHAVVAAVGTNKDHLWFEGYWGFKYYMVELDVRQIDACTTSLKVGDLFAIPSGQGMELRIPREITRPVFLTNSPLFPLLSTMSVRGSAGFYASFMGRLPFAFGRISSQQSAIFQLQQDFQLNDELRGPDNPRKEPTNPLPMTRQ